jgi:dTMP kinase
VFISLEGIDRSGKSTQADLLARALGPDTLLVREPGGTEVGERIRALLKDPGFSLDPLAELLLFCAARAQLVADVIRPAIEDGRDVVCDRFSDSSVAYQGAGRELGAEVAERLSTEATGGLEPELTILLRIEPAEAAGRERTGDGDRFEGEGEKLQHRVAAAYEVIAARHPDRVVVVDAADGAEAVQARVMEAVEAARAGAAGERRESSSGE